MAWRLSVEEGRKAPLGNPSVIPVLLIQAISA